MKASIRAFAFGAIAIFISMASQESKAYFTPGAWMSSYSSCYAYTYCPNGRFISCQSYAYSSAYGVNTCRYRVIPGRAVHCQGYASQYDGWGGHYWRFVNIPVSCF